jgi:3-methyladenine DNA glycosylase AlkC
MTENTLLKDSLNQKAIKHISKAFSLAMPTFNHAAFCKTAINGLDTLELKQRVAHIINALHLYLPSDFTETAAILLRVKQHWLNKESSSWGSFTAWPIIDYVAIYGLQHPHISLNLLKELTELFSAEFAIRPFIIHHFDITYAMLEKWCNDDNEHIRRLVSEGSRPRLPWGVRLHNFCDNPKPILPLLTKLRNDKSLYVRRSVANNLNDIAKDYPNIVIKTCKAWQKNASKETSWIIRHATRSLVKAGNPDALALLGYASSPKIEITTLNINNKHIQLGETLHFNFSLKPTSKQPQPLVIDYAIHHIKANGKTTKKVFKLKTFTLLENETVLLKKSHAFKPITTRQYYSGTHRIDILINGQCIQGLDFCLTV